MFGHSCQIFFRDLITTAKPSKYFHCFPVRLGLFHLSPNSLDRDTYSRYIKVVLRNPQSSEQRGSNFGLIFLHKGHKYCAAVSQVLIRHFGCTAPTKACSFCHKHYKADPWFFFLPFAHPYSDPLFASKSSLLPPAGDVFAHHSFTVMNP